MLKLKYLKKSVNVQEISQNNININNVNKKLYTTTNNNYQ